MFVPDTHRRLGIEARHSMLVCLYNTLAAYHVRPTKGTLFKGALDMDDRTCVAGSGFSRAHM
jgi:hypothetical protein